MLCNVQEVVTLHVNTCACSSVGVCAALADYYNLNLSLENSEKLIDVSVTAALSPGLKSFWHYCG